MSKVKCWKCGLVTYISDNRHFTRYILCSECADELNEVEDDDFYEGELTPSLDDGYGVLAYG